MSIINKSQCSPSAEKNLKKSGSCIVNKDLNNMLVQHKIINKKDVSTLSHSKKIDLLKKKSNCTNEACAVNKLDNTIYEKYFKPIMPKDWYKFSNEWLSNIDIENVLEQYENEPKFNFKLLAISPIDWNVKLGYFFNSECVTNELCSVNTKKINTFKKNKKWKLAIVFNTDTHSGPGQHWISLFVNMNERSKNYGIYYFDSNGSFESKYINDIIKKLKTHIDAINKKPIKVFSNKIAIQTTNSECGMYSLVFIIYMIKNKPFKEVLKIFKQDNKKDNHVFKHREILFNKI